MSKDNFEIKFKFLRTWQPAIPWMKISLADIEFCEKRLIEIVNCYKLLDYEMADKEINYSDSQYCKAASTACHVASVLANLERDVNSRINIIENGYSDYRGDNVYTKPMRQGR